MTRRAPQPPADRGGRSVPDGRGPARRRTGPGRRVALVCAGPRWRRTGGGSPRGAEVRDCHRDARAAESPRAGDHVGGRAARRRCAPPALRLCTRRRNAARGHARGDHEHRPPARSPARCRRRVVAPRPASGAAQRDHRLGTAPRARRLRHGAHALDRGSRPPPRDVAAGRSRGDALPGGRRRAGRSDPRGEFIIRNRLTRYRSAFYGPIALGTSARSTTLTDWPGGGYVGIHGTNEPELIPGAVSHGCIRMRNADIVRLARALPVGSPLTIR